MGVGDGPGGEGEVVANTEVVGNGEGSMTPTLLRDESGSVMLLEVER